MKKSGGNICFYKSGHPFCEYLIQTKGLVLPDLYSGSGTVTICATDFAIKAGFNKIKVLGADFSYSNGKAYACGTYLDRIYSSDSDRLKTSEQHFDTLMYRTELQKLNPNAFSTALLQAYKTSFEDYLLNNKATFIKKDDIYEIQNTNKESFNYSLRSVDIKQLAREYFDFSIENKQYNSIMDLGNKEISLLPLISWYRFHDNKNKADFKYYLKQAINFFEKYI